MKSKLVNEDCSLNKEELEKILAASKISESYNENAKKVLKKLLDEKNKNRNL